MTDILAQAIEQAGKEEPEPAAPPAPIDPNQWNMRDLFNFCKVIAPTEFVPKQYRGNPPTLLACVMTGREMGIGPMEALQQINVIDGRPAPSAQLMRRLILAAGHRLTITTNDECCSILGEREDGTKHEVTWTLADAQRAGLASKAVWKNYPRAMLLARATSELARALFPDCLGPARYTAEELDGGQPPDDDLEATE